MGDREIVRCYYCPKPAEYLCDWHATPVKDVNDIPTCDRPLCEDHRCSHGTVFFDGEISGIDSTDFCLDHQLTVAEGKERERIEMLLIALRESPTIQFPSE